MSIFDSKADDLCPYADLSNLLSSCNNALDYCKATAATTTTTKKPNVASKKYKWENLRASSFLPYDAVFVGQNFDRGGLFVIKGKNSQEGLFGKFMINLNLALLTNDKKEIASTDFQVSL